MLGASGARLSLRRKAAPLPENPRPAPAVGTHRIFQSQQPVARSRERYAGRAHEHRGGQTAW